jgi:gamma-glutamyltranspeptidase
MDDFSAKAECLIQALMLSSMDHCEKNGNFMILRFDYYVLQTMPTLAMRLPPRFHHQWLPDLITFEPNTFNTQTFTLKAKGYLIDENKPVIGKVDAILVLPNKKLEGGL